MYCFRGTKRNYKEIYKRYDLLKTLCMSMSILVIMAIRQVCWWIPQLCSALHEFEIIFDILSSCSKAYIFHHFFIHLSFLTIFTTLFFSHADKVFYFSFIFFFNLLLFIIYFKSLCECGHLIRWEKFSPSWNYLEA